MHLVVFEGSNWQAFAPLTLSRPVFGLASGAGTLLEKVVRQVKPSRVTLWVRDGLAESCRREWAGRLGVALAVNRPLDDSGAFLVNGRTFGLAGGVEPGEPFAVIDGAETVARAYVRMAGLSHLDALNQTDRWRSLLGLRRREEEGHLVSYLWDLIGLNAQSLAEDAAAFAARGVERQSGAFHMANEAEVLIAPGVKIEPGAVLDASRGPVMLDAESVIGANAVLKGPCYVGRQAMIKPMAVVHMGCTIGAGCKIGGEVNNSIFTANSNKAHDGYVGDSYVGEWVNLGGGTTTSNLKNTYGPITIKIGSREIETGRRNLGSLIGDHSKTAIGTRLMTGSYVGYCSMIATSALPPTFVPSFSFITDRGREGYRVEKAMEVMKAVFARRQRAWEERDGGVVRYVEGIAAGVEG